MSQTTLRNYLKNLSYIEVDGELFYINWVKFRKDSSFFIPCIQCNKLRKQIMTKATIACVPINCRYVVENKVKGIRVWRVL
jgi:hypothetical protein